jgi:hypothetical protein
MLRQAVEPLGVVDAGPGDLGQVRTLAATLISPSVASLATIRAVHARTGYGIYVVREEGAVAGWLALVMLNEQGLAAVRDDSFDPIDPDLGCLASPLEAPVAVYSWGIATASRPAAKSLIEACWVVRERLPDIPFFVRASTEAGHRLLTEKLCFVGYPGTTSGLLWWRRLDQARRAA